MSCIFGARQKRRSNSLQYKSSRKEAPQEKSSPSVRRKMRKVYKFLPMFSSKDKELRGREYAASSSDSGLSSDDEVEAEGVEVVVEEDKVIVNSSSEEEIEDGVIDPILLTPIGESEPRFTYTRPNGTQVLYRVESLIDYMLFAGKFMEPETNLPFSDSDLKCLDELAAKHSLNKSSVLESRHNPQRFANRQFNAIALVGLERCCGEVIGQIPDILENSYSRETAQVLLLTEIFPSVRHYYEQIAESDLEYANQSLDQYINFISGPPNCPVDDPHDLLEICTDFLKDLSSSNSATLTTI